MKKGFTLIEVLTVVLVIAVLTAVALPQYRRVVERAESTEAISMVRSIYDSSERLAAEFGRRNFPDLIDGGTMLASATMQRLDIVPDPEQEQGGQTFRCDILVNKGATINALRCPSGDPKWIYFMSPSHDSDLTNHGQYVTALNLKGKYPGTQIVFNRLDENIYCIPSSEDRDARACDVYNLDVMTSENKVSKTNLGKYLQ